MAKKKNCECEVSEEITEKKKTKESDDEIVGEEGVIDPAILEDTFYDDYSEYNDVDNF